MRLKLKCKDIIQLLIHLFYIYCLQSFIIKANAKYCQSCNIRPGVINVHIICHTHLDTGWVETYDEYFQHYVQTIYNSVTNSLRLNPKRKFIAVETSFFSRWYNLLTPSQQHFVRSLVQNGQLEFINGAWSMNDEAAAHYVAIIDSFTTGLKWLNQTFGPCGLSKTGWQVDPFGHSREHASLLAQMGFDSLFLGRIDLQDKELRTRTRNMEVMWKASPSIGNRCDIFTCVLPNAYWPPHGFCWDRNCMDPELTQHNIKAKALEFIAFAKNQSNFYATDHSVVTMGMDFYYRDAEKWYRNLDLLIDAVNSLTPQYKVHLLYSTPSCYATALNQMKREWPIKLDDFFPYSDPYDTYWTGYFTSRPSLKYAIKKGTSLLQAVNQLNVLAAKGFEHAETFRGLKETMGLLQHHDAVTGTCKQYVANDYQRMLSEARLDAENAIISSYITLMKGRMAPGQSVIGFCRQLNISECNYTELINDNVSTVVSIYNSIAHSLRHFIRIPVTSNEYIVLDHHNTIIPSQLVPIHPKILNLPERQSSATSELVFMSTLDPLGISSYLIAKTHTGQGHSTWSTLQNGNGGDVRLYNGRIGLSIDGRTGLIKEVQLPNGENVPFSQTFWYYTAPDVSSPRRPSGAYSFVTTRAPSIINTTTSYRIYRGPLVDEIHQIFTDWCTQVIRLYKNYNYIEFDWVVGPIPVDSQGGGLDIITRYDTNFQSRQVFFTDANGRETIRRKRDSRPTWDLKTIEKYGSNYYPVTSWIFIRDMSRDLQMTVLTDRSEGGSSMVDGTIELMLHRRLLRDDLYGMEEALNEPGYDNKGLIVRGKHRVIIDKIQESVRFMRKLSKTSSSIPVYIFRNVPAVHGPNLIYNLNSIGLREKLPANIHLLSLEQWDHNQILIRLEHFYEINEDIKFSRETHLSLTDLFVPFTIVSVREMNLAGVEELEKSEKGKMKWYAELDPYENYTRFLSSIFSRDSQIRPDNNGKVSVSFRPMQIRTFLVRIRPEAYLH